MGKRSRYYDSEDVHVHGEVDVGPDEPDDDNIAGGSTDSPKRISLNYTWHPENADWERLDSRGPIATEAKQDDLIASVGDETDASAGESGDGSLIALSKALRALLVESRNQLNDIDTNTDGLEGQLTTLIGEVDGLEEAIGTTPDADTENTVIGRLKQIVSQITTLRTEQDDNFTELDNALAAANASLDAIEASAAILDDWDQNDRAKTSPIPGEDGIEGGSGETTSKTTRVSQATDSLIGIRNLEGRQVPPRILEAFTTTAGSVTVEQNQDDVKLDWSNDDPNVFLVDDSVNGTASRVSGQGQVEFATSATPGSTIVFTSKSTVFYSAAHDDECEFTTEWVDVGGSGDYLVKGLFTATDGFGVGYKDGRLAFLHRKNGSDQFYYSDNGVADNWLKELTTGSPVEGFTKNGVDQVVQLSKTHRWKLQGALLGAEPWDLYLRTPDKEWLLVFRLFWANEENGSLLNQFDLKMRVEGSNAGTSSNLRVRSGSWRAGVYTSEPPDFTKLLNRYILDTEELRTDVEPTSSEYYLGKAADDTPTSEDAWDVLQISLSATRNPTRFRFRKNMAWDDRDLGWT